MKINIVNSIATNMLVALANTDNNFENLLALHTCDFLVASSFIMHKCNIDSSTFYYTNTAGSPTIHLRFDTIILFSFCSVLTSNNVFFYIF